MDKDQTKIRKKFLSFIFLGVIATTLLFYFAVYPILQFSMLGVDSYQGKELFLSQDYLEFKAGDEFCTAVENIDFVSQNDVRNFTYMDCRNQDHLLWGEFPDVYILDVYVGENYEDIYTKYWDESATSLMLADVVNGTENSPDMKLSNKIEIILHQTEQSKQKYNQLYLAFLEDSKVVRILYRVGISKPDEESINRLVQLLCCDMGQGDGSVVPGTRGRFCCPLRKKRNRP